ncbi:MAG: glycosyl hydrolase [Acidobacteria bacterium]|nr:glycosyl hydrolase [Acidobacteriota bacterium]
MLSIRRISVLAVALIGISAQLFAQQSPDTFKAMRWRSIGPFRGGRVLAVSGVVGDPNTYYFGGTGSGVWKTTDGGLNWTPLFDKQSISTVGAIAVADSDPNVIYVGTGEACIRGNISHGDGVYKSTDGGKTWANIGLRDSRHIGRIAVHPKNPNIVFVAAMGHIFGTNTERGLFRTTDGGKTWEKVLYKDEKTGAVDVVYAPGNSNILYAAMWEANRNEYSFSSGGPGSALYRSSDGGSTWKKIEGGGLPKTTLGRIGVAVSGADPNRVWALVEADEGGLFRSDDGGDTWRRTNEDRRFRQRAWYYTHVFADPKNIDTVYILNTGMYRSNDAGRTFATVPAPHGDHHGLWIDPENPNRMINSNDGGANVSINGGRTWTAQDNQPTAQFYHVITDNQWPYFVYGAQQDNSTVAIASRSNDGSIDRPDWYTVGGCESGYIAPDPRDANIVYAGCYGGHITRFNKRTGQAQEVNAWPENPMGASAGELKHRFQWTAPILISIHDPNVLYHAGEMLFKSTNGGMSWTTISPDLTRNDKSKQGPAGGSITHDNTSVEYYDVIFTVAESPKDKDLIWAGTDDGLIQITRDQGKTWSNVTPKDLPEWTRISLISTSAFDAGTAYVAANRYHSDDYRPYIYKTTDFGKSWTKIVAGIRENDFVRAVREDPARKGLLYAGTETGVYVSFNDGAQWKPLQLNLPTTPIHDLVVKDNDLVVATHGRSFWILDDLTPLQQWDEKSTAEDFHLFAPRTSIRGGGFGFGFSGANVGQNPPGGVVFYYHLKAAQKDELTLEITDGAGKLVKKLTSKETSAADLGIPAEFLAFLPPRRDRLSVDAGLQSVVWNQRYDNATSVPGAVLWGGSTQGPLAVPGKYIAKLTVAGKSQSVPFEIRLDPRVTTTQADMQMQFDLLWKIREQVNLAHGAVNDIRELRTQFATLRKRIPEGDKGKDLRAAFDALEKKMAPIEEAIIQVKSKSSQDALNYPIGINNKLVALASVVESADSAPTQQSYDVFESLKSRLTPSIEKWKEILSKDVAALNDMIRKSEITPLAVKSAN